MSIQSKSQLPQDEPISYDVTAFMHDEVFIMLRRKAALRLHSMRFYLDDPETPLQQQAKAYLHWLHAQGVNKAFTRWVCPLWTTETVRAEAINVYGLEQAPIVELGTRKVASYIRYLLFTRGWSAEAVTMHLVEHLGYQYNHTRPVIRRIMRSEAQQRLYHANQGEAALFEQDGVLVATH